MNHIDNPAGRLFLILKKAQKFDDKVTTKEAWAGIFEVETNNTVEILRKLGEVNQLPSKIRKRVYSLDVNHELHLKRLGKVESALGKINFSSRWQNFIKTIDDATILSIEHCSDLLSHNTNEKVLVVTRKVCLR